MNGSDYTDEKQIQITTISTVLYLGMHNDVAFLISDDRDDETILKLSDSFPEGKTGDIEVCVRMININYGHSPGVLDACKPLKEYSWLIAQIRSKGKELGILKAADRAIEDMPEEFLIKDFLIKHKAEAKEMLTTQYNEAEYLQLVKENYLEEGRVNTITELVRNGMLSSEKAASYLGISDEELSKLLLKE